MMLPPGLRWVPLGGAAYFFESFRYSLSLISLQIHFNKISFSITNTSQISRTYHFRLGVAVGNWWKSTFGNTSYEPGGGAVDAATTVVRLWKAVFPRDFNWSPQYKLSCISLNVRSVYWRTPNSKHFNNKRCPRLAQTSIFITRYSNIVTELKTHFLSKMIFCLLVIF